MKHCEYEDSTNCIWDAQVQGNGIGESFIDIDGSVYYTDDPTVYDDVWVDEGVSFPYQYVIAQVDGEDYMVITWEGEPTSSVDNNLAPIEPMELPVLEEVPEVVVEVPVIVDPVPEELANTGTGDVVVAGVLVGLALLAAGVVLFIRGRKNK